MRAFLAIQIAECRGRHFWAGNPCQYTGEAIFGVLDEMATDWILSRRNTRLESRAPEVADFLLRGLRGAGGGGVIEPDGLS